MKLVTLLGGVFKLTDREYRKLLEDAIANDGCFEMPERRCIGEYIPVTDLTADEAEELLERMNAKKRK